ncbi:MAG: outer membrane protein assembly factor BamA, partial [Victivallaceae bacterium]|nr:outer membrane protein assembly factor BamA [Victivallaceae bacterium]
MNIRGIALTLFLCAGLLSAAEIAEVVFDQSSAVKIPEAGLIPRIKLHKGGEFDRRTLSEDNKRLYETGNFADVVSETETLPDGKVKVIFHLRARPRVSRIEIDGNAKFETHELGREITLNEGGLLNDRQLQESAQKLRTFYVERGYRDVEVMPKIEADPQSSENVIVTFKIGEHLRLKVNDVTFEGMTIFSEREMRSSIANQYSYFNLVPFLNDFLNRGLLDRRELDLDRARIREKYLDRGYLDAKVVNVETTPTENDPEYVDVKFFIEEGEPYTVSKVTISGTEKFSAEELAPAVVLKENETFSLALEQQTSRNITGRYETFGYCDISCRAVRSEKFEDHTVAVDFVVAEGRAYHVRDVIIVGNTETKDKVLRRELAIQPGDPVDRNRIEVSRQRLLGMGYFTKVEADAINADALDEKDVRISVEENKERYHLRIGAGVSDFSSFFGMAEISSDNFDILNPGNWFYGGGQRMRIQGILGVEDAGFNIDFIEPWLFDIPLRFELSGFMNWTEYDQWRENHLGARTSLQHKVFDDFTTLSLGYKFEVVRVTGVNHRIKDYFHKHDLDGTFRTSQITLMLDRDTRDSLLDPTEGYNINLLAAISPRALGSSSDYYRLEAKGSYFISFFDKAIIAMIGAKIGTVASFSGRTDDVPVYERYLLGGGNSIRGFSYRSIGPHVNGENIGGETMLVMTAEVSHPIWGPLRGAFFVDAGSAWERS